MSYNFKKLADVEKVEALNDDASVLVETNGTVKRVNKAAIGGADWNANEGEKGYIENKPFSVLPNSTDKLTWDGVYTGLESVAVDVFNSGVQYFYKVADIPENFMQKVSETGVRLKRIHIYGYGEEETEHEHEAETILYRADNGARVCFLPASFICIQDSFNQGDEFAIEDDELGEIRHVFADANAKPGIYLFYGDVYEGESAYSVYTSEFVVPRAKIFASVKKIEAKFIPDAIVDGSAVTIFEERSDGEGGFLFTCNKTFKQCVADVRKGILNVVACREGNLGASRCALYKATFCDKDSYNIAYYFYGTGNRFGLRICEDGNIEFIEVT